MQKREFDSFERFSKQFDEFLRNLKKKTQKGRQVRNGSISNESVPREAFERQISEFFMNCNMLSMESECCDIAPFESIRSWVVDKLPIQGATKAHILKTRQGQDSLICIFFSNGEDVLLGERFPKKRILCGNGDHELNSFLNGAPMGTINL